MEPEEFEQIPWSNLVAEHRGQRVKLLYLAAAVIVAAVIGFVGIRWLSGPQHGPVPGDAAPTTVADDGNHPAGASPPVSTPASAAVADSISEADLQAAAPNSDAAVARMRAEWFVTDFFTVDGSPATAVDVARAFVADASIPPLPQEAHEEDDVSFVEWARAYGIDALASDRYLVDVAFRSIHRSGGETFQRGPVHAVAVTVVVADGAAAIAELPIPIVPPQPGDLAGWWSGLPAAEGVGAAALEYGRLFDADPELIEAAESDGTWRAVLTIGDGSGIRWPVAVRSDRLVRGD